MHPISVSDSSSYKTPESSGGGMPDLISYSPEQQEIRHVSSDQNIEPGLIKLLEENMYQREEMRRTIQGQLGELDKTLRKSKREKHREELLNARNSMVVIAILIASISFACGTNPRGQDRLFRGMETAYAVFVLSNAIAFFLSLSVVVMFASFVTYKTKALKKLLAVIHKMLLLAAGSVATAFVSACWLVLPRSKYTKWLSPIVLTIACITLGAVFIGVVVQFVEHSLTKTKWRVRREVREENTDLAQRSNSTLPTGSTGSDVLSSMRDGCYPF